MWRLIQCPRFTGFRRGEICSQHLFSSKQTLTGGEVTAPELMGHVAIPSTWKDFMLHRGCAFNSKSILDAGLIARWKGKQNKGRQTVFFTPLNPWRDETEDKFEGDLSKPRKVSALQD